MQNLLLLLLLLVWGCLWQQWFCWVVVRTRFVTDGRVW
jgi:hypothetical protein